MGSWDIQRTSTEIKDTNQSQWDYPEISHVWGDLFQSKHSLAHSVSQDLYMRQGMADRFRKRYGAIEEFNDQNKTKGEVAVLLRDNRYLYYLITKDRYDDKPLLHDLEKSLWSMKEYALRNNVHEISLPAIGSGLEGLRWTCVQERIRKVFEHSGIHI